MSLVFKRIIFEQLSLAQEITEALRDIQKNDCEGD